MCIIYTSACLGGWVCSGCTCPTADMWRSEDSRERIKLRPPSLSYSAPIHASRSPPSFIFHKTVFVLVLGSIGSNSSFVIPVSPILLVRVSNLNPLTPRNILCFIIELWEYSQNFPLLSRSFLCICGQLFQSVNAWEMTWESSQRSPPHLSIKSHQSSDRLLSQCHI